MGLYDCWIGRTEDCCNFEGAFSYDGHLRDGYRESGRCIICADVCSGDRRREVFKKLNTAFRMKIICWNKSGGCFLVGCRFIPYCVVFCREADIDFTNGSGQ